MNFLVLVLSLLVAFIAGSAMAIDLQGADSLIPKALPDNPLSYLELEGYQPNDQDHYLFAAPQSEEPTEDLSQQNKPSIVNLNDPRSSQIHLPTQGDRSIKEVWRTLSGIVWDSTHSKQLCALVLANGQNMFSCSPDGPYNLTIPEDSQGKITVFAFVDGQLPFKKTFTWGSFDGEIVMPKSSCTGPQCGNGICETGENASSCPTDCKPAAQCGNGICETGENASSCPTDCSGQTTTIKLSITDGCLNGKKMYWKFFDVDQKLVWPAPPNAYTGAENVRYTSSLLCNVGKKICYGATENLSSNSPYWGVGINGDQACPSCCYTCQSGIDEGWRLTCN